MCKSKGIVETWRRSESKVTAGVCLKCAGVRVRPYGRLCAEPKSFESPLRHSLGCWFRVRAQGHSPLCLRELL